MKVRSLARCSSRDRFQGRSKWMRSQQIYAFARGIGADENAQRLLRGVRVEGRLDLLAPVLAGGAGEDADALIGTIRIGNGFSQASLQPAPCVLPFREDDETAIVPARPCHQVGLDPSHEKCRRDFKGYFWDYIPEFESSHLTRPVPLPIHN
jgi:hypothetical protein